MTINYIPNDPNSRDAMPMRRQPAQPDRPPGRAGFTFAQHAPQIVAAGFLPGHAAAFGDHSQMAVAPSRGGSGRSTGHRAGPRRHDDEAALDACPTG
jgi:hypothetical protein